MLSSIYLQTYNPVNIRWSKSNNWLGQIGSYRGFVIFETPDHGYRAAMVLIANYIRKGYDTASTIIPRFAPPAENNTSNYLKYLSRYIDLDAIIDPYCPLFYDLLCHMAKYETGSVIDRAYLLYLKNKFNLN